MSGNIELAGEALIYMPYGKYVAVSRKLTEPVRQALKEIGQRIKEPSEGMILRTETEKLSETDLQSRLQKERERWQHLLKKSQSLKAPAPLFVMNHFLEEINAILMKMNVDEIVVDVKPLAQQLKERYGNRYPISFYREKENLISHYTLQKEWESLHKKVVWLKNGANIVIEESEAFTIIDINTAKFTASSEKEAAIRKTNMLAAQEIAKQIRLRNMGGNIFIDFINMKMNTTEMQLFNY